MAQESTPERDSWQARLDRYAADGGCWLMLPDNPCRSDARRELSYLELQRSVHQLGGALRALGGARAPVVVVADSSAESCLLLLAALVAGMVIVPVAPGGLSRRNRRWVDFIERACSDTQARLVVGRAAALPAQVEGARLIDFEQLMNKPGVCDLEFEVPSADELALLQYTSGTTSSAKAVELTHGNLEHNLKAVAQASRSSPQDAGVTWLPLYHDMGLTTGLLCGTYTGMRIVMLSPRAFYMRPEAWLWAVSRFGAKYTIGPSSAYLLCATQVTDAKLAGLDLSGLEIAGCGAELVHPRTVEAFVARFSPMGFLPEAFWPVYGLAENTNAATVPAAPRAPLIDWVDRERLERDRIAIAVPRQAVGCRGVAALGRSLPGQRLRVVDAGGQLLGERRVGRVQVKGPSVMRGYHRQPAATAAVLDGDGWLDTGDRGYLAAAELYITGRDKHVIKRVGRAFDADDLSAVVQRLPQVYRATAVVFGVDDAERGHEQLVAVVETRARDEAALRGLHREVSDALHHASGSRPDAVQLVRPGQIPRTTSGKIQVEQTRERYLAQSFDSASDVRPDPDGSPR